MRASCDVWLSSLALCSLIGALNGCVPHAGRCGQSGDCVAGALCFEGVCRAPCIGEEDCVEGHCDFGVCLPGAAPPLGPSTADGGEGAPESGPPDSGPRDAGAHDGGEQDASVVHDASSPLDSGPRDVSIPPDGGALLDAGPPDAGPPDAGPLLDAGPADVPPPLDAGAPADAGTCARTDPYGADLNGDCLPDIVVSAPSEAAPAGQSERRDATVSVLLGQPDGDFTQVASGFLFGLESHGRFGATIALDPERGADGTRAFFVGEPHPFGRGATHYFTLSAATGALERDTAVAPEGVQGFGHSVALAGGALGQRSALAVGATSQATPNGEAQVAFALAESPGALRAGTGTVYTPIGLWPGAVMTAPAAHVARVPDRDGDGRSDFAISAAGVTGSAGNPLSVILLSSASGAHIGELAPPRLAGLSFGSHIAALPDYDGDGLGEIALSEPDRGKGRVYVAYSSQPGAYIMLLPPPDISADARFGASVAVGGDLDGDGIDDIAIGAPFHHRAFPDDPIADAPLDECATLRGSGYTGNCSGSVLLVFSATLVGAAADPNAITIAESCLAGTEGTRMGTALRALGPSPVDGQQRLAYGSPGLSDRPGKLGLFTGSASASEGCAGELAAFTLHTPEGDPIAGTFLGTAVGR